MAASVNDNGEEDVTMEQWHSILRKTEELVERMAILNTTTSVASEIIRVLATIEPASPRGGASHATYARAS